MSNAVQPCHRIRHLICTWHVKHEHVEAHTITPPETTDAQIKLQDFHNTLNEFLNPFTEILNFTECKGIPERKQIIDFPILFNGVV